LAEQLTLNQCGQGEILGKSAFSEARAAQGAAVSAKMAAGDMASDHSVDPDLAAVVEAWPKLPATIKADILAMVTKAAPRG